jgi:hypothetical protein
MTTDNPARVRLSGCGQVVIGLVCPCGCSIYERELSVEELTAFLDALHVEIAMAERVEQLRLPWIHEEGQA